MGYVSITLTNWGFNLGYNIFFFMQKWEGNH